MNKALALALSLLFAAAAGTAGWWLGKHERTTAAPAVTASKERKVLYYQSPMHPWITSPKPGKCTICGMTLVPVYEGEKTDRFTAAGLIKLPQDTVEVIGVATSKVEKKVISRTLKVSGMIDDDNSRHRLISAWAEGRIEKLFVPYVGANVVEGQPLATYSSKELVAAQQDLLQILKAGEVAASALPGARERLKRLGLTDAQIQDLEATRELRWSVEIVSPISGTVLSRAAYEGQLVTAGTQLFEVADFSKMWFEFPVYERDLPWLSVGQKVTLHTDSVPGKEWTEPIAFIDPNFDERTRSTKARVILPNPFVTVGTETRRELSHKLYADAVVQTTDVSGLSLPRSAVLDSGKGPVAYVEHAPGVFEARTLKLGRSGDNDVEVLEGLEEGESVVVTGALLIDSQARITSTTTEAKTEGSTL